VPFAVALLLALLPAVVPHASTHAAEVAEADAVAVRAVIEAQLAAFRRDDGPAAFAHAAPEIQALFGTPERFMTMVRQGYAPVYRPRQVFFQPLLRHEEEGAPVWVQPLLVTVQDGSVVVALYRMARQPDGAWRIAGVVLLPAAGRGA
jgi:hypothetical protein